MRYHKNKGDTVYCDFLSYFAAWINLDNDASMNDTALIIIHSFIFYQLHELCRVRDPERSIHLQKWTSFGKILKSFLQYKSYFFQTLWWNIDYYTIYLTKTVNPEKFRLSNLAIFIVANHNRIAHIARAVDFSHSWSPTYVVTLETWNRFEAAPQFSSWLLSTDFVIRFWSCRSYRNVSNRTIWFDSIWFKAVFDFKNISQIPILHTLFHEVSRVL